MQVEAAKDAKPNGSGIQMTVGPDPTPVSTSAVKSVQTIFDAVRAERRESREQRAERAESREQQQQQQAGRCCCPAVGAAAPVSESLQLPTTW